MRRERSANSAERAQRRTIQFLAIAAAALCARPAIGQVLTWDSSGATPATPVDGSGNWNTVTPPNWTDGVSNFAWVNGDTANIGSGGTAGTITIDDASGTVSVAGINFNAVASGNYSIAGSGTNTLTLVAPGAITVASGLSPAIVAPIAGTVGLTVNGPGTLNVGGVNTFTGGVNVNSGSLVVGAASNLGDVSNLLVVGTPNTGVSVGDAVGAVTLNSSQTVSSFKSATNNSAATNTVSIPAGSTLNVNANAALTGANSTVNAVFVAGTPNVSAIINTKLTMSGGGALAVSGGAGNASFLAGVGNSNSSANTGTITLDLSGLSSFSFTTGTGAVPLNGGNEFAVGHGAGATGSMTLAANNTITAGTITVGDNSITPGLGSGSLPNAPTNPTILNLGSATNILNASKIVLGNVRSQGTIQWLSATTTGTATIAGPTGGASTVDMLIGQFSGGTPPSSASALDLRGHSATVQAGTIVLGNFITGGGNGTATSGKGGSILFDTGTFNVANLQMANASGTGGLSGSSINATVQVGVSNNSTGVFNVTGQFLIGNVQGTNVNSKGTFNIRGGTANVFTNIIDVSTVNTSANALVLSGGTLNMNGFAIGTTAGGTGGLRTIGTITLPTATNSAALLNLGGNGINNAGLTMNGAGALIISGTASTYTGNTTISSGFLQFGQASDTAAPNGIGAGNVTNSATLLLGSSQNPTLANTISGTGTVGMIGSGITTVTGNNSYTGSTQIAAGVLSVNSITPEGNLGGTNSPIGASNKNASNLVLTGGTLRYTGSGSNTDRQLSITANGGTIDASGTGPLQFGLVGGNFVSSDAAPRSATESTSSTRITMPGVLDLVVGMGVAGNNIPPGTTITSINKTTGSVTLSNTPTASGTEVITFSGVLSRSLTLTGSNAGDNTISPNLADSTNGGTLSLIKSGTGTWVLAGTNTYSGPTSVAGGLLKVSSSANLGNAGPNNNLALSNGGTLQATGALSSASRSVTLNNTGGTIDTNGNPVSFGTVEGSGNFTKAGAGTLSVVHVRNTGQLGVNSGRLAINPNGNLTGVSVVNATSIGSGQLDLADNHLIDHTTTAGTWTGSNYTGLTGYVASGRNTGNWDGNGVVTSQTQAIGSNYTSIGVALASDVRPNTATATDLWAGQTITGTDTLVMYTYGGDATLDGKINIDDYVKIDSGIAGGYTGWVNGDFNYDGKVSIDDYITVIDANIGNQTGVFFTASGGPASAGPGSGVSAVPEPATTSVVILGAALTNLRRRRRRNTEIL